MEIREISNSLEKQKYTETILRKLPEWFGIEESIIEYMEKVKDYPFFAAMNEINECIGFFSVKPYYEKTGDIYVCGIDPKYIGKGIGSKLYNEVEKFCRERKYRYIIVKTLSDIVEYEPYERTRKFYEKMGFEKLITLTEMWDADNPCLIMIKEIE